MIKKSNNPKVEELSKSHKERSFNLGYLKAISRTEDNKLFRYCAWCAEVKLRHGNQKYCSPDCSTSAMAWAYPQKEDALRFLLERQGWKCLLCQFDYKPFIEKEVLADRFRKQGPVTEEEIIKLPWYYFKRLKNRVDKAHKPEVDHVVPIYKGGQALGLDNHQAICFTCHKTKTSKDLSGKRVVSPT